MAQRFDAGKFRRDMQAAARKAERQINAEIDRVNRENQRRVDAYNRQVEQRNRREIERFNSQVRAVNTHNSHVDSKNRATVESLRKQLRSAASGPRYTPPEAALADRIHERAMESSGREWDAFLSHARIDGAGVGDQLRAELEALGVSVWFDAIAITPGKSQSLQMDKGLCSARVGIALLTPAYLTGRFWTERELGALLHKEVLIPVLHGVTFAEVAEYSGILPDLAGFETARDPIDVIAQKIAAAVLPDSAVA